MKLLKIFIASFLSLFVMSCTSSRLAQAPPETLMYEKSMAFPTDEQISGDFDDFVAQMAASRAQDSLQARSANTTYYVLSISGMTIGTAGAAYGVFAKSTDDAKKVATVTSIVTAAVSAVVTFLNSGPTAKQHEANYKYWDHAIKTFKAQWSLSFPSDSQSLTAYKKAKQDVINGVPYQ